MTRSKYHAVRTVVDGITFASKAEAKRYQELRLLAKAGEIADLKLQPAYALGAPTPSGRLECVATYRADFSYRRGGAVIVEDVKGVRTPVYRLKRKWMRVQHGIEIQEVTR